MLKWMFLVGLGMILAGCVSEEERQRAYAAQAMADLQYCDILGATFGTPEHAQCRLLITQLRAADAIERRRASSSLTAIGAGLLATSQPKPMPRLQTTCSTVGTITNCY